MKITFLIIGCLFANVALAIQTISCPSPAIEFTFNEKNLDSVNESTFKDLEGGIFGKFTTVALTSGRLVLENKNINGTYIKIVLPGHLVSSTSEEASFMYYRINDSWSEGPVFGCVSKLH